MASFLISEVAKHSIEDEDWVVLSPDVTINSYTSKMQAAWHILMKSVAQQTMDGQVKAGRGQCLCGYNNKSERNVCCEMLHHESILRVFISTFKGSGNSSTTVELDLQALEARISLLRSARRYITWDYCQFDTLKVLKAFKFSLESGEDVGAAFTFFLGWFSSLTTALPEQQDHVLKKLIELVPETIKNPPMLRFGDSFMDSEFHCSPRPSCSLAFGRHATILTLSGAKTSINGIDPRAPSTISQMIVFKGWWQRALLRATIAQDQETKLRDFLSTTKHLALRTLDLGGFSEALSLYIQMFIAEYIILGPQSEHTSGTLEELRKLAFCCHQDDLVESLFLKQKTIGIQQSNISVGAGDESPTNALFDALHTVCDYFTGPPGLLSIITGILPETLDLLEEIFSKYEPSPISRYRLQRALARRFHEEHDGTNAEAYLLEALTTIAELHTKAEANDKCANDENIPDLAESDYNAFKSSLELDLALVLLKSSDKGKRDQAEALGQSAFRGFIKEARRQGHGPYSWSQLLNCRDRLLECGLTHWSFDQTAKAPFIIEGNLGQGAYSVVNSVTWAGDGSVEYAQKIYRIPTKSTNKDYYMAAINNEIEAIRKLRPDPHIVRIEYTYTEQQTFVVVLSPRADEDLQSYLERQVSSDQTMSDSGTRRRPNNPNKESLELGRLIRKWFYCLSSSLTLIHSQGVRHKDVKSRNILIKDTQVLYADFGSSRIFESELTSSTSGTANGNTPMYSAPEVISGQKRSRSADIFSLGCVFTEMLTVKGGKSLAEYHEFRNSTFTDQWDVDYTTCAYHKTLDKVDQWFDADEKMFKEYRAFIRPMLAFDRMKRPSALETAVAIRKFYRGFQGTTCGACDPSWRAIAIT